MEQITVDLIPGGKMPLLHASQYDEGREYRINLTENKQAYTLDGTELLTVSVRKGDNTLFTADIANTFGGKSYVDFVSTEQMCACAGFSFGELSIEKNNTRIGTINFMLVCEPSPEASGLTSESEINNLNRQIDDYLDETLPDVLDDDVPPVVERVIDETLAPVAKSGNYNDLENKPSIPAAQVNSDWDSNSGVSQILNKPTIPTKTSQLHNDSGFTTIDDSTASASKVYSSNKVAAIANTKADKNVVVTSFVQLTKAYTPACISPSGWVNQGALTNGFSVSNAYPIGDLTKIIIPYDFTPRDNDYLVIGFYSGTGLGTLISGVGGAQNAGLVVSVPSGANYFRITCPDSELFGIAKTATSTLAVQREVDRITDRIYSKGAYIVKGDLASGEKFEIPQTNCQNNQVYSFTAKSSDFSNLNLIIGHGKTAYDSSYITITPTSCDFTRYSSSASVTSNSHGLTLSKFIDVKIIVKKHGTAKVVIQTEDDGNGVYEYTLDLTTWTGCSGDATGEVTTFAELVSGALTDCVFSWSCSDFRKQLWAFGDSYFAYYGSNFMQILDNDGFYDNILVNGFSGENSQKSVVALKNMLQYFGKPKYILWCLGQNDGSDTTESNYTNWLSYLCEVLDICSDNGITPILCTIPSVPKGGGRSHESKNAWIRSSGYRYVDMAKAVGSEWNNGTVTWYSDMLKSDNEHPNVEGGKAIEKRMLLECPELTFGKP